MTAIAIIAVCMVVSLAAAAIGWALRPREREYDPFFHPFGEMPTLPHVGAGLKPAPTEAHRDPSSAPAGGVPLDDIDRVDWITPCDAARRRRA